MKTKPTLLLVILILLHFSCSKNDPVLPPEPGKPIEMPVSIEVSRGKQQVSRASDHEWVMQGTCNANKVMLLVFKGPSGATSANIPDFNYISRQILDCKPAGNKRIARGSIIGEANATYAVFAIAYNDTTDLSRFILADTNSTFKDVKIRLTPTAGGAKPDSYNTPEFFVGYVMPSGNTAKAFAADGKVQLSGTLYRAVGKCTFTIKAIPSYIQKVVWITEEMTNYCNIYNPDQEYEEYPMGFPGSGKQLKKPSQVAEAARGTLSQGATEWDAFMESFFIPLSESLFYIDAIDDDGTTTRYLVKCPDRWEYTIYIGILNVIVSEYKFSIAHNWFIGISGNFSQLKNSGNMVIDLTDVNAEYDGGILPPVISPE